jgi:hypothetical protein
MRHNAIVIPESFRDFREAEQWCAEQCKERGVAVQISYYLPDKSKVFLRCLALKREGYDIDHLDVYDAVRCGGHVE